MRKRPITARLAASFLVLSCLRNHRRDRANHRIGKEFVKGSLALVAQGAWAFNLLLLSPPFLSLADESSTPPEPTPLVQLEQTNSQELLQAIMQLQDQLHSNQLAFEQSEQEAKVAAALNSEALSNGLRNIENAVSAQQEAFSARSTRELEAIESSNRVILSGAFTFAAIGFLAMLITAYFQWRMSKVWEDISTLLPTAPGLGRGSPVAALSAGGQPLVPSALVEDSNLRLLAAIEHLEKRIQDLEQS